MSKTKIIRLVIFFCIVSITIFSVILLIFENGYDNEKYTPVQTVSNTMEYTVGCYGERIAVYISGNDEPIEIFDVFVDTLPEADRERLKKGINANDKEQLRVLIEDYTS